MCGGAKPRVQSLYSRQHLWRQATTPPLPLLLVTVVVVVVVVVEEFAF
jgi:hypothetical protein